MNNLFGNQNPMMSKSLDFLWKKQQVTSSNIANVDTPGYKGKYVTFEETFRSRLQAARASGSSERVRQAIGDSSSQIHTTNAESARLDGNNVNQDAEMVELTRTALQYQYVLDSMSSNTTRLRTVIKGQ